MCTTSAEIPALVRVEGAAEELSQMVISCTGGTPTPAGLPIPGLNIDATLNTNVTSRLLDSSGNRSEALLLLDEPQPAEQVEAGAVPFAGTVTALGAGQYKGPGRPNVFGGQQMSPTSLRWSNIPFDPPGSGTRTIRIVNVRANANSLGVAGIFVPSPVTMTVAASGAANPPIDNTFQTVAYVVSGMVVSAAPVTAELCTPFTPCTGASTVSLNRDTVAFTATAGGAVISPAQDVIVSTTGGVASWSASSDSAWLMVTPGTGQTGGSFRLSVAAWALPSVGVYTGRITVTVPGASNSPIFLNSTLTVTSGGTSGGTGAPKIVKVSGDGQLTLLYNGFTVPLVVRVQDAAGVPIPGKTVTWAAQGGASYSGSSVTTTDANGLAKAVAVPGGLFTPGTPFLVYSLTATTDIGATSFTMTSYPITGVSNYNPPPMITLNKPAQGSFTITAKLGATTMDAVRAQVLSGGGNATNPTVIPGVALNVSTSNTDPAAGVVARCAGGIPLSDVNGIVSCDLIVEGRVGNAPLLVNIGALRDFPGVQLIVTPGDPAAPVILQGNNQTGKPGASLPVSLFVRIADAFGNPLSATPVSWSVVPANAATLFNAASQSDANGNASAQVQLGATPGSFQVKVAAGGRESIFILTVEGNAPSVTLSLNRSTLTFDATAAGSAVSPPQDVLLTVTGGSNKWTAFSNSAWLGVTPASGLGSGRFSVYLVPAALPAPGVYTGNITVNATGAINGPLTVNCTLTVKAVSTAPFGSFDTPVDNTTGVSGSIAVTGWALDDIGVKQLTIWRGPIGAEPVYSNGLVYIGDAAFVAGARPDVAALHPTTPNANRAGWGYLMLTNALPGNGNGTFRLYAIAVDQDGNQTNLGSKTIGVDNLHSIKPFGAIDAPAPGQTVSGTFVNSGWALTPQPALIPLDGSTIWVSVDGVNVGNPSYGALRSDVGSLFPNYANSNSSAGQYNFVTNSYSNVMHTLAWIVYDNLGHGAGIGSRFFNIQNGAPAISAGAQPVSPAAAEAGPVLRLRTARLQRSTAPSASYPAFRLGYDPDAELTPIRQAGDGLLEPIPLKELDRLEIHLPGGQEWTAALRFGDELRDLPIGSTFDAEGGIFYWQLGPGFLGEFTLEFRASDGTIHPVVVLVGALVYK